MKFIKISILILLLVSVAACNNQGSEDLVKDNQDVNEGEDVQPDDESAEDIDNEEDKQGDTEGKQKQSETDQENPPTNQEETPGETEEDNEKGEEIPKELSPDEIGLVIKDGQLSLSKKFFNDIEMVDGVSTIQNPNNLLVMANKSYYLSSDYSPNDLVQPEVPFVFEGADQNYMRKVASNALEKMFAKAKDKGIHLIARSGFRSYNIQAIVFQRNVDEMGYDEAILVSAKPGTSEHQTGLTMDITANSVGQHLTQDFGDTKEGIWLKENAHKFGFIMRYPEGKEDITKYSYEPWHFRYVGKEAAKVIYENNWTLEEFFEIVSEI